jgi:condensin-2 complex subunit D3
MVEQLKSYDGIIDFLIKYAHSSKTTSRAFASQLMAHFVIDIERIMRYDTDKIPETTMEMGNRLQNQLNDIAPTVRAAALDGISLIMPVMDDHVCSAILQRIVDVNGALLATLSSRIIDEKLVVRRAALSCIYEILSHSSDPQPALVDLLAGRARDRATSLRQQAVKAMGHVVGLFSENENLCRIWLDSILPLIVDTETTVQNEAFESLRHHIFEPIELGKPEIFTPLLSPAHLDFIRNIFALYKTKAVSLAKIAKGLIKRIRTDFLRTADWSLIAILTEVEPSHIKPQAFLDFWDSRHDLPPEYYIILAHLRCQRDGLLEEVMVTLNDNLRGNSQNFALIAALLLFIRGQISDNEEPWLSLIQEQCEWIRRVVQDELAVGADLTSVLSPIYALGILVNGTKTPKRLMDFDFSGIEVLLSEQMPNQVQIPSAVRSITAITVGKLCLQRPDFARSNVSIFVHQLSASGDPVLKCNCLVCLCDLCVKYSALVDDHISVMTNSLADDSSTVRQQTLTIVTRLVVEDYIKMRPILFFKYLCALTDQVESVASFAQCCLFHVILAKHPELITSHFIDALYYFSRDLDLLGFDQTDEEASLFTMNDSERRRKTWNLMVGHLSDTGIYVMIETIFNQVLWKYQTEELDLVEHSTVLEDGIYVLLHLEERRKTTTDIEAPPEELTSVDGAKKLFNEAHAKMLMSILPILNGMHRLLRIHNSPLQGQLNKFYQCICEKTPGMLAQVEKTEPILAAELREEMGKTAVIENSRLPLRTPPRQPVPFASPLLAQIASTPRALLCSPSPGARVSPLRTFMRREMATPPHTAELE